MTGQPKILVIEDDTPVAMLAVFMLTRAGCDVLVAHTGVKGLNLASESRFDLIALDLNLPDISGFEICRELKQRHISRNTPVIIISGCSCEHDVLHGLELGAADYITKPFNPSDFVRRVLAHTEFETNLVERQKQQ